MPLIKSPTATASAKILEQINQVSFGCHIAARALNDINITLLALDNTSLSEFANDLGPAEMTQLTTLHGTQGDAINQLIAGCNLVFESLGLLQSNYHVDTRPLAEKLLSQQREIEYDGVKFTVKNKSI